jgi:hypothetical protein
MYGASDIYNSPLSRKEMFGVEGGIFVGGIKSRKARIERLCDKIKGFVSKTDPDAGPANLNVKKVTKWAGKISKHVGKVLEKESSWKVSPTVQAILDFSNSKDFEQLHQDLGFSVGGARSAAEDVSEAGEYAPEEDTYQDIERSAWEDPYSMAEYGPEGGYTTPEGTYVAQGFPTASQYYEQYPSAFQTGPSYPSPLYPRWNRWAERHPHKAYALTHPHRAARQAARHAARQSAYTYRPTTHAMPMRRAGPISRGAGLRGAGRRFGGVEGAIYAGVGDAFDRVDLFGKKDTRSHDEIWREFAAKNPRKALKMLEDIRQRGEGSAESRRERGRVFDLWASRHPKKAHKYMMKMKEEARERSEEREGFSGFLDESIYAGVGDAMDRQDLFGGLQRTDLFGGLQRTDLFGSATGMDPTIGLGSFMPIRENQSLDRLDTLFEDFEESDEDAALLDLDLDDESGELEEVGFRPGRGRRGPGRMARMESRQQHKLGRAQLLREKAAAMAATHPRRAARLNWLADLAEKRAGRIEQHQQQIESRRGTAAYGALTFWQQHEAARTDQIEAALQAADPASLDSISALVEHYYNNTNDPDDRVQRKMDKLAEKIMGRLGATWQPMDYETQTAFNTGASAFEAATSDVEHLASYGFLARDVARRLTRLQREYAQVRRAGGKNAEEKAEKILGEIAVLSKRIEALKAMPNVGVMGQESSAPYAPMRTPEELGDGSQAEPRASYAPTDEEISRAIQPRKVLPFGVGEDVPDDPEVDQLEEDEDWDDLNVSSLGGD